MVRDKHPALRHAKQRNMKPACAGGRKGGDSSTLRMPGPSGALCRVRAQGLVIAIAACLIVVLGAQVCAPSGAWAVGEQEKLAIPSISKQVSTDGKAYRDEVSSFPGGTVHYRLQLTMPENIAGLDTLVYTARDVPNDNIAVKMSSISAKLVSSSGSVKGRIEPKPTLISGALSIELGDLKDQFSHLQFGDVVVIDYDAVVSTSAKEGSYPNVAKLTYDLGAGEKDTAKVMATVRTTGQAQADGKGSTLARTGDGLVGLPALCLSAAAASGLVIGLARRREKGAGGDVSS